MQFLDLTLPTPAENVALDEALLDEAELDEAQHYEAYRGSAPRETLRLWEPEQTMVVVGRSSRVAEEVNVDRCRAEGVPIFRRSSGGAAIVAGPGCLMYSVVLSYHLRPHLRMLDEAHRFVLELNKAAIAPLRAGIELCGTSDLAIAGRKFSGNSLRCKRGHLLYHGTLLVDFPLPRVEELLGAAPRQPEYRARRTHSEFLTNLHVSTERLRDALIAAWQANVPRSDWPQSSTKALVSERYGTDAWNLRGTTA